MSVYVFINMHGTVLYEGAHTSEDEAWWAFWNVCRYPDWARDAEDCQERGIRVSVKEAAP